MRLKEITPENMLCNSGCCPAIFETERDTYLIIGKRIKTVEENNLSHRTSSDEVVVEVPRELLVKLK